VSRGKPKLWVVEERIGRDWFRCPDIPADHKGAAETWRRRLQARRRVVRIRRLGGR